MACRLLILYLFFSVIVTSIDVFHVINIFLFLEFLLAVEIVLTIIIILIIRCGLFFFNIVVICNGCYTISRMSKISGWNSGNSSCCYWCSFNQQCRYFMKITSLFMIFFILLLLLPSLLFFLLLLFALIELLFVKFF